MSDLGVTGRRARKRHTGFPMLSLFAAFALGLISTGFLADDNAIDSGHYGDCRYRISIDSKADKNIEAIANDLGVAIWGKDIGPNMLWRTPKNPGCCLRLEVRPWIPTGQQGFVINVQHGGALVTATDIKQLRAAADQLKTSMIVHRGRPHLPLGLQSNYPLAITTKSPELSQDEGERSGSG
ncbi:hypothetical protein Pan216_00100 [Planctomycetes bacterium Pan216]|uniref:Uncharacterized protein n=2 Tax=Kolteria novifilia TaxID=2527975 RepID=A0A518AWT3_9BACT|nr:hypothetical protein Pan216_00100 [Planctomycetes bacterium Pan216]